MKNILLAAVVFTLALSLTAKQPPDVDVGHSNGSIFESTYFKFEYKFPDGWSALDDTVRMAENRQRHEEQVKKGLEEHGPNTATHKFQVFTPYYLLVAGKEKVTTTDTRMLPYITVQAEEPMPFVLHDPDDFPKLIAELPGTTLLRQAEKVKLGGKTFSRSDSRNASGSYHSQFVTKTRDYLIVFDLHARTEEEMLKLADTMQTLRFQ